MRPSAPFALLALLAVLLPNHPAFAAADALGSAKLGAAALSPSSRPPSGRQYAPDREAEVEHLVLDITPDFARRTISGVATYTFKPRLRPVAQVRLNAVDLDILEVAASEAVRAHEVTREELIVTFQEPIPVERSCTLTIRYGSEPEQGLYFRTPEMGYTEGDTHLFTQCEAILARHWFPSFDSPNRMFTSETICRVPNGMTVISNGRLVEKEADPSGLVRFHYRQEQPHVNYLISIVAGYFEKVEDKHGGVPLAFYTPPSLIAEAPNSFRGTREMMEFFEQDIGVAYPWPKYDQVCVNDFVAGGMENTSATTLTDYTLFSAESENLQSSEGLVAHELAHQWFGDLVTCKDWSHLWLNEGFATYYETLYTGHAHGRDEMLYELYTRRASLVSMENDVEPIVRRTFEHPDHMFGHLTYPKASWVLHMLRIQLGDEVYRQCVKTYLERHRHQNVETEDLRKIIEEISGRSFDQFFDQWLYHGHFPELEIQYSWDEPSRLAKFSVRQAQKLGPTVLLFDAPLPVRLAGAFGVTNFTMQIARDQEDFYLALPSAPTSVRVDPEVTLLARINFEPPGPMLDAQLTNRTDAIGRIVAVEQLAKKKDKAVAEKLGRLLREDSFWAVRLEASKALKTMHSDDALSELLASTEQPDARVRRQVWDDIGDFYRPSARDKAIAGVHIEKNPEILGTIARGLGGYDGEETREILLRFLNSSTYRNQLAQAALQAIRAQDDPMYIAPLLSALQDRGSVFTTWGYGEGLTTLGYLARNETDKTQVRRFLAGALADPRRGVQLGAIRALGELGDPRAVAVLEKLAAGGKESDLSRTARDSVNKLRAARQPVDDFKNLRQEVTDLRRANGDLRKELDELKARFEARMKAEPEPAK